MEWISVEEKYPDPKKEEGWYLVLISRNPHVVYFSFRYANTPWHIPPEWREPTHYIKLDSVGDIWRNRVSNAMVED
jgi:hypothetical protein